MHPALEAAAETIRQADADNIRHTVADVLNLCVHSVDPSGDIAVHAVTEVNNGWRWLDHDELEAVAERLRTA
jgi:hypothetical protein